MEIQAQASVTMGTANASNTNASVTNGNSAASALSGTATGEFSATLNGIMGSVPAATAGNTPIILSGSDVLVQLLASLKMNIASADEPSSEDLLKQLDLLVNLLDTASEGKEILENPDLQAWLLEIQNFMLLQPQTLVTSAINEQTDVESLPVSATAQQMAVESIPTEGINPDSPAQLNPLLFVPIHLNASKVESDEVATHASREPLTKAEAFKLLDNFKLLLQSNDKETFSPQADKALQAMVDQMQKLVVSFTQATSINKTEQIIDVEAVAPINIEKPAAKAFGNAHLLGSRAAVSKGNHADVPVQVVLTGANSKLEYLAANFVQTKLVVDNSVSDQPLFEPLQEFSNDLTDDSPAIPMHEFLKHVQSSQPMVKPPVIIIQAPNFVEDMTQFVIKSFTVDTKSEGFTEAKLSLFPQNLGQVDVKLTMHNGQLVAHFMADNSLGKEMLESQLSQLRTTLQNQGIQVERLEVSQNQAFQSGMFQDQRQQHSQQSNKQQKGSNSEKVLSLGEEINQEISSLTNATNGVEITSIDTKA
jgi:flagellar hook-length control protein FliK